MVSDPRAPDYDVRRLLAAVQAMPPILIELEPVMALGLVGTLQLALRHPGFTNRTATIIRNLVEDLKQRFPPEVRPLLDRGDDPAFDVEVSP